MGSKKVEGEQLPVEAASDSNDGLGGEVLILSKDDQIAFAEALLSPPEPNDALKRAFESRKRLFCEDA